MGGRRILTSALLFGVALAACGGPGGIAEVDLQIRVTADRTTVKTGEGFPVRVTRVWRKDIEPSPWDDPRHATAAFPDTGLGLLHAIPPIGTKFHPAGDLGPTGETPVGGGAYRGEVYLRLESPLGEQSLAEGRPLANKETTR